MGDIMLSDISRLLDDAQELRSWAKGAFDDHDPDRKGSIDRAELFSAVQKALQALSTDPSLPLEEVLREIAIEGDGPVDFEEYVMKVQESLQKLAGNVKPEETAAEVEEPPIEEPQVEVQEPVEVSPEVREQRMKNVARFEQYVESSGLAKVFQIIFAEIMTKKIEQANVFAYTAMRLRQIGKEIAPMLPANVAPPRPTGDTPSP